MAASEIAEVLQISANVVKSRLHRARAALKRMVAKEFEALGVEVDGVHDFECTWQYLSASAKDTGSCSGLGFSILWLIA